MVKLYKKNVNVGISDIPIQVSKFGTAKLINTYLEATFL